MKFRAALFDFDYTLADSTPGIVDCVNTALCAMGLAAADEAAIRRTVGLSLADIFCALTGPLEADRCREFSGLFIRRADEIMADRTTLYAPVRDVMQTLRASALNTGIVTTKFQRRIVTILTRENMLDLFDVIVGGENVVAPKPDPEGLLLALDRLNVAPEEAVYVGDSMVDAETAHRAGTTFVAVTTGITEAEAFSEFAPLAVLDSVAALPGVLATTPQP